MEILNDYFKKTIKGKTVVDLGFAGFGEQYGERAQILIDHSKAWYGGDLDKEFIKKNNRDGNLFYCDLNNHDYINKFPKDIDLIVLIEVIEHLHSPFNTLKYIVDNKGSKTKVLVSVPNSLSFGKVFYGIFKKEKLLKQDKHHYYSFNEQTLRNIFKDVGFKNIKIVPYVRNGLMKTFLQFIPNFTSGYLIVCK